MNKIDIITALESPELFKPLLGKHPETWDTWKVFLKAVFALSMNENEFEIYKKHTGRNELPIKKADEVFAIVGRRGGKSFITSLIAAFIVLFDDYWTDDLAPGERVIFPIIATDRVQSKVIFNYIQGILNSKRIFKNRIIKETLEDIELKNNVTISIKTPSFRGVRGPKYIGAALDELAFWRDQATAANPADEIIKAIRPAIVPGGILFGISSAFNRAGVLYEEYSGNFGIDDNETLIWHAGTLDMNPLYSQKKIDKALSKDSAHAKAEYFSEWRDDISSLYYSASIDDAIIPGRYELSPNLLDNRYCAFCDPSGGRHDSMTLAIGHHSKESKIVIDLLREVKPGKVGFSPSSVVKEFSNILKNYGLHQIYGDKYGGQWVKEAFQKEGINLIYSDLTASDLYLNMLPELNNRTIELLDSPRLRAQLLGLMRKTISGGRDKVVPAPGMDNHADLANAVAGVVFLASKTLYRGNHNFKIIRKRREYRESNDMIKIYNSLGTNNGKSSRDFWYPPRRR